MFVIGITGGIGCGKSTAANICNEYGLPVLDADRISHEVTSSDGCAIEEIKDAFGAGIVDGNNALDRDKMAGLVFQDKKSLDKLSRIVHKHVLEQMRLKIEIYRQEKTKSIVLDVPIPVKEGFVDICDQVWLIWTDDPIRISRLVRRGMPEEEAGRRISSQMTKEEYEKLSDIVIMNNGSIDELRESVTANLDEQLHMRGIKV